MTRPVREDLDGRPTVNAAQMRVGVCKCGDLVGIDMLDRAGITIAHGHLDIEQAEEFHRMYGAAIAEIRASLRPN